MKKQIIRLTESDIRNIVKDCIRETYRDTYYDNAVNPSVNGSQGGYYNPNTSAMYSDDMTPAQIRSRKANMAKAKWKGIKNGGQSLKGNKMLVNKVHQTIGQLLQDLNGIQNRIAERSAKPKLRMRQWNQALSVLRYLETYLGNVMNNNQMFQDLAESIGYFNKQQLTEIWGIGNAWNKIKQGASNLKNKFTNGGGNDEGLDSAPVDFHNIQSEIQTAYQYLRYLPAEYGPIQKAELAIRTLSRIVQEIS